MTHRPHRYGVILQLVDGIDDPLPDGTGGHVTPGPVTVSFHGGMDGGVATMLLDEQVGGAVDVDVWGHDINRYGINSLVVFTG